MRHPYRTVPIVVATVVLLTGCSVSYPFQLLLTVKNAEDGQPIEGVTGYFGQSNEDEPNAQFEYGFPLRQETNAEGRLTYDFQVSGSPDHYAHWYLKLRKDGFTPLVIDVRPGVVPKNNDPKTPIPVVVKMEPLPKKP